MVDALEHHARRLDTLLQSPAWDLLEIARLMNLFRLTRVTSTVPWVGFHATRPLRQNGNGRLDAARRRYVNFYLDDELWRLYPGEFVVFVRRK